jgi:hypothetical protein
MCATARTNHQATPIKTASGGATSPVERGSRLLAEAQDRRARRAAELDQVVTLLERTQLATIRTPHQPQHRWSTARSSICQGSMARSAATATAWCGPDRVMASMPMLMGALPSWNPGMHAVGR